MSAASFRRRLRIETCDRHRERFWSSVVPEEYACPGCGWLPDGSARDAGFEVHHRNGDPFDGHAVNLVALCHRCHRQTHRLESVQARLDAMRAEFAALGSGSA